MDFTMSFHLVGPITCTFDSLESKQNAGSGVNGRKKLTIGKNRKRMNGFCLFKIDEGTIGKVLTYVRLDYILCSVVSFHKQNI